MSALNSTVPAATPDEVPGWTEADVNAALQTAFWFDSSATEELIGPYRGMHIALFDKRIIDTDRDPAELCRRLDAKSDSLPPGRLVLRYIPTVEEALQFRY